MINNKQNDIYLKFLDSINNLDNSSVELMLADFLSNRNKKEYYPDTYTIYFCPKENKLVLIMKKPHTEGIFNTNFTISFFGFKEITSLFDKENLSYITSKIKDLLFKKYHKIVSFLISDDLDDTDIYSKVITRTLPISEFSISFFERIRIDSLIKINHLYTDDSIIEIIITKINNYILNEINLRDNEYTSTDVFHKNINYLYKINNNLSRKIDKMFKNIYFKAKYKKKFLTLIKNISNNLIMNNLIINIKKENITNNDVFNIFYISGIKSDNYLVSDLKLYIYDDSPFRYHSINMLIRSGFNIVLIGSPAEEILVYLMDSFPEDASSTQTNLVISEQVLEQVEMIKNKRIDELNNTVLNLKLQNLKKNINEK